MLAGQPEREPHGFCSDGKSCNLGGLAAYPRRVRIGNFLRNLAPDTTGRAHGPNERGDLAAAGDRLSGAAAASALTLTSKSAVNRKSDRDNDHNDDQPMFNRQAAHVSVPLQEIPTPRGWSALTRSGAKNVRERHVDLARVLAL